MLCRSAVIAEFWLEETESNRHARSARLTVGWITNSPHPRINQLSAGCPDPICTGTKRVRASCAAVTLQGNCEIQQDTLLLHFIYIFRRRCLELKSKNSIRYFFCSIAVACLSCETIRKEDFISHWHGIRESNASHRIESARIYR